MDTPSKGNETPIKPELFAPHAGFFHSQRIQYSRTCMDTGRKGQKVVAVLSLFSLHFGAFLGIIPFTSDTCALIGVWCLNPAMDK